MPSINFQASIYLPNDHPIVWGNPVVSSLWDALRGSLDDGFFISLELLEFRADERWEEPVLNTTNRRLAAREVVDRAPSFEDDKFAEWRNDAIPGGPRKEEPKKEGDDEDSKLALDLIAMLVDDINPCRRDHHGECQEHHGNFLAGPGGCWNEVAKELLARHGR